MASALLDSSWPVSGLLGVEGSLEPVVLFARSASEPGRLACTAGGAVSFFGAAGFFGDLAGSFVAIAGVAGLTGLG